MEIFECWNVKDNKIIVSSEKQLESLFMCIKKGEEILLRWDDEEDSDVKRSRILITTDLISKIVDGRFIIESRKEVGEE